ncbi:MAG: C39 family peptidase [Armatimonadota bacterium]
MLRIILRLLVVAIFTNVALGYAGHSDLEPPQKYYVDGVPFTPQQTNFCGPASMSSLLAFWGIRIGQTGIADKTLADRKTGTNGADLLLYARDLGLSAYSFNGTIADLKKSVSKGYPVLILQDKSRTSRDGHFRVVVGYNDLRGTVTLRDSVQPGLIIQPYTEWDQLWARRGRWALMVAPNGKDVFKETLGRANPVLHLDLAQAYLHRGLFSRAEQECTKALGIEPGNSYALKLLNLAKTHKVLKS